MEMSGELEDDLFFADLSKQISLLIMDDDDDANCPSLSLHQAFSHAIQPPVQVQVQHQAQFVYGQSCVRESKGTGVFIPQSTQPRRNRQRQSSRFISNNNNNNNSSYYAKSQKQQVVALDNHQQVVASNASFKSKLCKGMN